MLRAIHSAYTLTLVLNNTPNQIKPAESYGESASSYSKRSVSRSLYSTDGDGLSSRSSIRSSSSGRYGADSGLAESSYSKRSLIHSGESDGGKYGELTSNYSRRIHTESGGEGADGTLSSSYSRKYASESSEAGDGLSSSYARKYLSDSGDGESYSYSRKTAISSSLDAGDAGGSLKYSTARRSVGSSGEGELAGSLKYTHKSITSYGDDDEDDVKNIVEKYSRRSSKDSSSVRAMSIGEDEEVASKFSKYERHLSKESVKKSSMVSTEEDAEIEAEMRRKYAPDSVKETGGSSVNEKRASSSSRKISLNETDTSYSHYGKFLQTVSHFLVTQFNTF